MKLFPWFKKPAAPAVPPPITINHPDDVRINGQCAGQVADAQANHPALAGAIQAALKAKWEEVEKAHVEAIVGLQKTHAETISRMENEHAETVAGLQKQVAESSREKT